ncbi:hypothetical protein, partial [Streptomyces nanshensis]
MAEKATAVVISGVAGPDDAAHDAETAALWAAIEDSGIVPAPGRPVTVLTDEQVPGLAGIPGLTVKRVNGASPWAAARTALEAGTATAVAVHAPDAGVAVVLSCSEDPGQRYGALGDDPGTRVAALRPAPIP